jgi:uncharacterized protein YehS (DUF1456 family)
MNPNDILRRLRYALDLNDAQLVEVFAAGGHTVSVEDVRSWMTRDGEDDYVPCPGQRLGQFLDALILQRRGAPADGKAPPPAPPTITNNQVLRKLRIALILHETDMVDILKSVDQPLSKSELSALFRKPDHRHYRACGDQVLRKFLRGLTLRLRGDVGTEPDDA